MALFNFYMHVLTTLYQNKAMNSSQHAIFLTGMPGVGKTTLIKKVIKIFQSKYPSSKLTIRGFYTEEVTESNSVKRFPSSSITSTNIRIGFDIITISDNNIQSTRTILARKPGYWPTNFPPYRNFPNVKDYFIDTKNWPEIVIPLLKPTKSESSMESINSQDVPKSIIIIDEIGKMENFSNAFVQAAWELLFGQTLEIAQDKKMKQQACFVLGTVTKHGGGNLAEKIRNFGDLKDDDRGGKRISIIEVKKENRENLAEFVVRNIERALDIKI
ncbi:hypothetical protein G9A89_009178 [Geosiphon pyriformis]|nr:hypothetical protein G9A89_009178 [Geosiphon pyriformis]